MLKEELQSALSFQEKRLAKSDLGLSRSELSEIQPEPAFIQVISGIRRAGKSTLMRQLISKVNGELVFINFEDPRLFGIELSDLTKIDEILGEDIDYYFFDEIQNIPNWEVFVRNLHDREKSICLTGSNASLLSQELGTRLTGRYLKNELFPFSYKEFCSFHTLTCDSKSLELYLRMGGFPEFLKTENEEVLQQLLRDIVYRDVAIRYGIRNTKELMDVALFLISNVGKTYSLNKIAANFGLGSANTVLNFVNWFHDAYLMFSIPKFSWSLKAQKRNLKKIYSIDTAFARVNSLSFSEDSGRLLENCIFLALRKKYENIFYFQEEGECDFVIKEKNQITKAIQVCHQLNSDNKDREINGLLESMRLFQLNEGTIVTMTQQDQIKIENMTIRVQPAYDFLLEY